MTGNRSYLKGEILGPATESVRGVQVHRLDVPAVSNSLLSRALFYPRFLFSAYRYLDNCLEPGDLLVAMTDPPMSVVPCARLARRHKAILLTWMHDLFPEIARALHVPLVRGRSYRVLQAIRDRALMQADRHVAISAAMAERLVSLGIPGQRIMLIRNWADGDALRPIPPDKPDLRREWGLENKVVFAYSGNLGRGHDWETLLDAAIRLRDQQTIRIVVIGHGSGFERLAQAISAQRLENVLMQPFQPRERLPDTLAVADVHLVSLQPPLEGLMSPSKLAGALAVGRPVIYLGDPQAEAAHLLAGHACGKTIAPGEGRALAETLKEWAGNADNRHAMGERARALFEAEFDQTAWLARWAELLSAMESEYRWQASYLVPRKRTFFSVS